MPQYPSFIPLDLLLRYLLLPSKQAIKLDHRLVHEQARKFCWQSLIRGRTLVGLVFISGDGAVHDLTQLLVSPPTHDGGNKSIMEYRLGRPIASILCQILQPDDEIQGNRCFHVIIGLPTVKYIIIIVLYIIRVNPSFTANPFSTGRCYCFHHLSRNLSPTNWTRFVWTCLDFSVGVSTIKFTSTPL